MSPMSRFGFGEKLLDALLGSAEVLRPFSDRDYVLHAWRDVHSTEILVKVWKHVVTTSEGL